MAKKESLAWLEAGEFGVTGNERTSRESMDPIQASGEQDHVGQKNNPRKLHSPLKHEHPDHAMHGVPY